MSTLSAMASKDEQAREAKKQLRAWLLAGMPGTPAMDEAALIVLLDVHDRLETLTQPAIIRESKS